jgi:serine protease inhibitor
MHYSDIGSRSRSSSQLESPRKPPLPSVLLESRSMVEKNSGLEEFLGKSTKNFTIPLKGNKNKDFFNEEEEEEEDEDDFFNEKVEIKKDFSDVDLLSLISKETVQPIITKKKVKSISNLNQEQSSSVNASSEIKTSHFIHSIQYIGNEVMKRIDHPGNILVSPWSLMTLMSMILNLNSNKKEILSSLFHLKIQQEDGVSKRINHLIKKEMTNLKKNSNYIFSNSIWTKNGASSVDQESSEDLKNYLMTSVQKFTSTSEVNEWLDDHTDGHITSVLDKNTPKLNSKEKMLISTSYFKGIWKYRFDSKKTVYSNFYLNENESKKIYMMQQKGIFKYADHEIYQGVELEYGMLNKSNLSMLILLPKKNYSTNDIMDVTPNLKEMSGTLQLPKFRLFFSIDSLSDVFLDLIGSKNIFDTDYILIQKSYLDVSEEGLENNSQLYSKSDFYETESGFEMVVDHPFTILVRDVTNNMILYQGIVKNPILLN